MNSKLCSTNVLTNESVQSPKIRIAPGGRPKIRWAANAVLATMFAVLVAPSQAGTDQWTVKDLGTVGGTSSAAMAVNDFGQVTGESLVAGGQAYHAFIYKNGVMTDISGAPAWINMGRGINNAGHVVGYTATSWAQEQVKVSPFLYKNGVMSLLSDQAGAATAINESGHIVGSVGPAGHAFLYKNGAMADLGTLGGKSSSASAINNRDQVVGQSDTKDSFHAFLYSNGRMKDLGTLAGGAFSRAYGINDNGDVVGESLLADFATHAFLYSGNQMHDIGTLGGTFSRAYSINNTGQIVGLSNTTTSPAEIPFLYANGKMTSINSLKGVKESGWTLHDAQAINNKGQIVGRGTLNNKQHAYLLSPPERESYGACSHHQMGHRGGSSYGTSGAACDVHISPYGRR